jgi:hypothetical protein
MWHDQSCQQGLKPIFFKNLFLYVLSTEIRYLHYPLLFPGVQLKISIRVILKNKTKNTEVAKDKFVKLFTKKLHQDVKCVLRTTFDFCI